MPAEVTTVCDIIFFIVQCTNWLTTTIYLLYPKLLQVGNPPILKIGFFLCLDNSLGNDLPTVESVIFS